MYEPATTVTIPTERVGKGSEIVINASREEGVETRHSPKDAPAQGCKILATPICGDRHDTLNFARPEAQQSKTMLSWYPQSTLSFFMQPLFFIISVLSGLADDARHIFSLVSTTPRTFVRANTRRGRSSRFPRTTPRVVMTALLCFVASPFVRASESSARSSTLPPHDDFAFNRHCEDNTMVILLWLVSFLAFFFCYFGLSTHHVRRLRSSAMGSVFYSAAFMFCLIMQLGSLHVSDGGLFFHSNKCHVLYVISTQFISACLVIIVEHLLGLVFYGLFEPLLDRAYVHFHRIVDRYPLVRRLSHSKFVQCVLVLLPYFSWLIYMDPEPWYYLWCTVVDEFVPVVSLVFYYMLFVILGYVILLWILLLAIWAWAMGFWGVIGFLRGLVVLGLAAMVRLSRHRLPYLLTLLSSIHVVNGQRVSDVSATTSVLHGLVEFLCGLIPLQPSAFIRYACKFFGTKFVELRHKLLVLLSYPFAGLPSFGGSGITVLIPILTTLVCLYLVRHLPFIWAHLYTTSQSRAHSRLRSMFNSDRSDTARMRAFALVGNAYMGTVLGAALRGLLFQSEHVTTTNVDLVRIRALLGLPSHYVSVLPPLPAGSVGDLKYRVVEDGTLLRFGSGDFMMPHHHVIGHASFLGFWRVSVAVERSFSVQARNHRVGYIPPSRNLPRFESDLVVVQHVTPHFNPFLSRSIARVLDIIGDDSPPFSRSLASSYSFSKLYTHTVSAEGDSVFMSQASSFDAIEITNKLLNHAHVRWLSAKNASAAVVFSALGPEVDEVTRTAGMYLITQGFVVPGVVPRVLLAPEVPDQSFETGFWGLVDGFGRAMNVATICNPLVLTGGLGYGAPVVSRANELDTALRRNVAPANDIPSRKLPRHVYQAASFFVGKLVSRRLCRLTHDEVAARMDKPSQKRDRDGIDPISDNLIDRLHHSKKMFTKNEAVAIGKPARNIVTMSPERLYNAASFTGALADELSKFPFWVWGKGSGSVAWSISEMCKKYSSLIESDFSKFDGSQPIFARAFCSMLMKKAFSARDYEVWRTLESDTFCQFGITGLGTFVPLRWMMLSGSNETSVFNTAFQAFLQFLAIYEHIGDLESSWSVILDCKVGGDDGLVPDVGQDLAATCKRLNMIVDVDRHSTDKRCKFLGRVYLHPRHSPDSIGDVADFLQTAHMVTMGALSDVRQGIVNRANGWRLTDPRTPIIKEWCDAAFRTYPDLVPGFLANDNWWLQHYDKHDPIDLACNPPSDDEVLLDAAKQLGVSVEALVNLRSFLADPNTRLVPGDSLPALETYIHRPLKTGVVFKGVPLGDWTPPPVLPRFTRLMASQAQDDFDYAMDVLTKLVRAQFPDPDVVDCVAIFDGPLPPVVDRPIPDAVSRSLLSPPVNGGSKGNPPFVPPLPPLGNGGNLPSSATSAVHRPPPVAHHAVIPPSRCNALSNSAQEDASLMGLPVPHDVKSSTLSALSSMHDDAGSVTTHSTASLVCGFCHSTTHKMYTDGVKTCPSLLSRICKLCGNSGHTERKCTETCTVCGEPAHGECGPAAPAPRRRAKKQRKFNRRR